MNSELKNWMDTPGIYSKVKMKDRPKYSLLEEFGVDSLPVHPNIGKTLNKILKWMHEPIESIGWHHCSSCYTLEPDIPNKHHPACLTYSELDAFPESPESYFGKCPKCDSRDGLGIDSCRYSEVSKITCDDCEFEYRGCCDEETLEERFRKKYKRVSV